MKVKVTITSVTVETTKFIFCMCDCKVDSDACMENSSLMLEVLQVCGRVHVRSHVSPSMGCTNDRS